MCNTTFNTREPFWDFLLEKGRRNSKKEKKSLIYIVPGYILVHIVSVVRCTTKYLQNQPRCKRQISPKYDHRSVKANHSCSLICVGNGFPDF